MVSVTGGGMVGSVRFSLARSGMCGVQCNIS